MCGIFGCISQDNANEQQRQLFVAVSLADVVRGKDSTGYLLANKEAVYLVKKALDAYKFYEKGYTKAVFEKDWHIAIGHNRAASSGSVTDRNAHPFALKVGKDRYDFGCHNGTFVRDIATRLKTQEFEVDSLVVLNKVAVLKAKGLTAKKAIRSVFNEISNKELGNYAILYFDTDTMRVYAFRDTQRPLYAFQTKNLGLWFCSTEEIFRTAYTYLEVAGKLPDYDSEVEKVIPLAPYKIYTEKNGKIEVVDEILSPKEIAELEERKKERERISYLKYTSRLFEEDDDDDDVDWEKEFRKLYTPSTKREFKNY